MHFPDPKSLAISDPFHDPETLPKIHDPSRLFRTLSKSGNPVNGIVSFQKKKSDSLRI